jgi:regulator of sigma D
MELIVVKKDELVKAYQRLNVIKNTTKHETPNETIIDAENQVNAMIGYFSEGHIEEETAEIKTTVVANFMEHCKKEGVNLTDSLFETFFDA